MFASFRNSVKWANEKRIGDESDSDRDYYEKRKRREFSGYSPNSSIRNRNGM
jgi:hypothetical protein